MLLTLIILSGSFGFSLAKGKGFEGGFPDTSGLSKYRLGNLGDKRKPEPEIQYDQSEEKSSIMEIKEHNLIRGKKDLPTIKKPVKIQDLQRLDLGVYQVHILQIFKKLPVQLVQ